MEYPANGALATGRVFHMPINTPRNRYTTILVSIAVLILVVGWQIRPRKNSDSPASQADLTRLARLSQRSNIEGMASFFADLARQASGGLVWVEGLQMGGLVWDQSGSILVSRQIPNPYQQGWLRGADESVIALQTELYSAPLSFRMLKPPPELSLEHPRQAPAATLRAGNWLMRTWKTSPQTYEFDIGILSGLRPVNCGGLEAQELLSSFPGEDRTLGSGVFDMEGRLVGVTLHCGTAPAVILAESIKGAVDRGRAVDSQVQYRYGFLAVEPPPDTRSYFGMEGGLLIQEVWRDTLAWESGLRPGDWITAQDGEPANKLEDLAMMTVPMYRPQYTLTVKRGRSARKVILPPGAGLTDEPESASRRAVAFETPSDGMLIRRVNPGGPADRAGLKAGDRIISTGAQFGAGRLDPAAVNAPRQSPLYLVVERAGKAFGLFLE